MRRVFLLGALFVTGLCAIVAGAACDSFDAGDAPPTPDAASDATTGSSDVAVQPDAPLVDTGSDAAAPFCATDGGTLCEDFDDPGSASLPKTALSDGSTLEEVEDAHVSAPRSLHVRVPLPPDSDCQSAVRYNDSLDVPIPQGFRLEYKVKTAPLDGGLLLGATLQLRDTNADGSLCSVYLTSFPNTSVLAFDQKGGGLKEVPLARKVVAGQWSHVVIEVKGGPGGRKASVTIDGVSALTDADLEQCQSFDRIFQLNVGLLCVTNEVGGDSDVAFDDIRLTAR